MWLLYTIYVPSEKNKRFQEVEKSARMLTSAMKRSVALEQKAQRIYVAYVLQRTLNERAIEKYQRLQASEKDKLEPVRIVSLMYFDDLEDTEENWRRPIDKERAEELLKQESQPTPSGSRRDWIVTGMALFYIVFMLASLEELVSGTAINTLKKRTDRETQ